jgi:hypothetical protein
MHIIYSICLQTFKVIKFHKWKSISILLPTDSPNLEDIQVIDSLLLDLSMLREATDNFSDSNKLGEGGFGAVYKVAIISKH